MKPIILLLSLMLLSACSPKSTTTETKTTETTTVAIKQETKTFQYKENLSGLEQTVTETVSYTGDSFDKLHLEVTQAFDQTTITSLQNQDFETMKKTLLEKLENQEAVKQFRQVEGANLTLDMTKDKGVQISINIDMKKIDLDKLSQVQGLGIDFTELEKVTPEQYINLLKENGATELSSNN